MSARLHRLEGKDRGSISRRKCLTQLTRIASLVVASAASYLAGRPARAAKRGNAKMCCVYWDEWDHGFLTFCIRGTECPPTREIRGKYGKATVDLYDSFPVSKCTECPGDW
jgi:hypothetical protein